jgi:outer membrane protein OmpA-like peptidoglycan-associated protein
VSEDGPAQGKARAETIKQYLVDVFGIDSSRITTEGRDKPEIPSVVPGATRELGLLRAEDRRVDIESNSPGIMMQVGGAARNMLMPVQIVTEAEDPLDAQVLFYVIGAKEALASWSLEITDEQGKVQRYGPSTRDREGISGNTILGDRSQGNYKVVMLGQTKGGKFVRKESSVHLIRRVEPAKEALRFSVLFGFDKSETIASYQTFLTDIVAPLIPDSGVVVIRGHTDIVGSEEYNDSLSTQRVQDAQGILERAIAKSGKHGITFATFGFGEDLRYAPYDNYFPEERFYNRTVMIELIPD